MWYGGGLLVIRGVAMTFALRGQMLDAAHHVDPVALVLPAAEPSGPDGFLDSSVGLLLAALKCVHDLCV